MTGVETQILGRIVNEASKPLIRNVKRALARRGFGKTEFYDEIAKIETQLGKVPTLKLLNILPKGVTEQSISRFIQSPEMLQHARVRLSAELASDEAARSTVSEQITALFHARYENAHENELRIYIEGFQAQLAEHCSNIKVALNRQLRSSQESLTWAYENISNAYLASIRINSKVGNPPSNVRQHDIKKWVRRYRDVFDALHRGIEIPDLSNRRRVNYEMLYVGSTLAPTSKESAELSAIQGGGVAITDESILHLVDRTVLLGDPGAGKSTTSNVLAIRAWEALNVVPIIIVMKEIREIHYGFPVVEHIETIMKAKYQCAVDSGVIERLLLDGKVLLIFDGLDELVNGAHRLLAAQIIEIASRSYPLSRVVVTSRRTGYSIARLDPEIFDEFQLEAFNVTQVEAYVAKWLALQPSTDLNEVQELVADFMRTSESIDDLRTNPLLLAFICVLYRGHRSIPRRRPELYRKCVDLLLAEWDKARGISNEDAEVDLYEIVLTRLAYLIATETGGTNGELTEERVFAIGVPALLEEEVPTEREARGIVSEVLRLCRGRAWIFTDVGLDADGHDLFGFTHASFVEYFAARHIYRSTNSPEEVAQELIPRVAAGQWEVLAQICLSLGRSGKIAGGSRAIIRMLDHVDGVLAGRLAARHRATLSLSATNIVRESSYQTDGDVAIVDFLLRSSDTLPMSSDALNRLVRLSLNQLAEGRSRTLGVILEKRYKYQAEACNRVVEMLNDGIAQVVNGRASGNDAQQFAMAWLFIHFPYMLRSPDNYQISVEAVNGLCSRLIAPSGDWGSIALRTPSWKQIVLQLGKAEVVDDGSELLADRAVRGYESIFQSLSPPIEDFGPASTATWMVDCLVATDVMAASSRHSIPILRQIGETLTGIPLNAGLPPQLSISRIDTKSLRPISRRLHGYGKHVLTGWLFVSMGLLELVALVKAMPRSVLVEDVGMDQVFGGYCAAGILPSAEYDEWLHDYERIWVIDDNQVAA